jgi:ferrochelatase
MRIDTLINLIGGELLNRPYISEVVHFTDNPKEVVRGSCFIAKDERLVKEAIKKGAYAILSEKPLEIVDEEIAWIVVSDIKRAIFEIFRYENIKQKIFFADELSVEIIKSMNQDKKVVILSSIEDYLKALSIKNPILVTCDEMIKRIFSDVEELKPMDIELEFVTLFKSRFKKSEINLPVIYKEFFSKAIKFFKDFELKHTLDFKINRFRPLFINHLFEAVDYGKSEKVVILGLRNDELFFDELNYIVKNTKHAKTLFIDKKRKHLLKEPFNFAVMVDCEFELSKREERGLFDD